MLKVVLRDLEGVLRRNICETLIVDEFKTENLLPPGENYGSTIFKVDAVIRRSKDADKEDLHMIAKMLPPSVQQREIFKSPVSFRKEIAMYEQILKAYRQLEFESGFKENELFDIGPKYYGSRLSLDPNVDFDDDAVILLENLKHKGYFCGKRLVGYDLDQTKLILKSLARFHALGIVMKLKKPEEFAKLKILSQCWKLKSDEEADEFMKNLVERMIGDHVIGKYASKFAYIDFNVFKDSWLANPEEPWGTIIHSDFWVNNMMLRADENGKPDDVKFVDFQIYMYLSPLRDLIFFLFTSLDDDTRKHIDELVDFYYDSFLDILIRMECDVTNFSRETFDNCLAADAKLELVHCMMMLKIITIDIETDGADNTMITNVMKFQGNELFMKRVREIILYCIGKEWL